MVTKIIGLLSFDFWSIYLFIQIFGLDSQDGTVVWDHYLPDLAQYESSGKPSLPLYVQRTTAHFPNPPQCSIVGKSKVSSSFATVCI